ncbi:MAG: hypothetical protein RLZZ385_2742 [Pseudomonadota bacterium]|jgi:metallo-beta-lactamase family protein
MANITFYGAAREVTGSCRLLESPTCGRILLDCGMHQGGDAVARLRKDKFKFKPARIDAVILSHAHLDHSGLLPKLVHQGFNGPIYCTPATAALLDIMLNDSTGLYEKDLERENLRRQRSGRAPLPAEYSSEDVRKVLKLCKTRGYEKPLQLSPDASFTFFDAGHILGSAIVEITLREDGAEKTLVFSGDLGKPGSFLMNDPRVLSKADIVLMEGTYGDRNHRTLDNTVEQLRDLLAETWRRGGNVMIPSFAVGRAQEIIFHLGCLHHQGLLDDWQVFLDSPMAIEVTRVYDRWLHLLDDADVKQLSDVHRKSLEDFLPTLKLCQTPDESMAINKIKTGALIIAGSGMCTGGRIRHHFKHRIWNENNTIIFVGFQAMGTLGRIIVDGAKRIRIFGEQFAVKSKVETLGGFSAHAGQQELIEWVSHFKPAPRLVLVHGEPAALQTLSTCLQDRIGLPSSMPQIGDVISF